MKRSRKESPAKGLFYYAQFKSVTNITLQTDGIRLLLLHQLSNSAKQDGDKIMNYNPNLISKIETTTRGEAYYAIKWAYKTFLGLDYGIAGWDWINIPGNYDSANGSTTHFSMQCIEEAFGMNSFIDVLQYKAYYKNDPLHKSLVLDLIFKAAEIRYKHCQIEEKFLNDYKFYARIRSSINDKLELEKIKLEIKKIKKEIHWPHFYSSLTELECLMNIVLETRRTPCANDNARPDSAYEVISSIMNCYPAKPEAKSEFRSYAHSICDNNERTEEEDEEFEGYQSGVVNNQPFKNLLSKLKA